MLSKCAKCGSHLFGLQEQSPAGSAFKLQFVQCNGCGAPIGVMDYMNVGAMLEGIEDKIDKINSKVESLDYDIALIKNKLR